VSAELIVDAVDEDAAIETAMYEARDDVMKPENCTAAKLTDASQIPSVWKGCIPWGNKKEQTVEQVCMANDKVKRRAPSTFAPTPGSTTEEGKI
jgi:hypothetical protein